MGKEKRSAKSSVKSSDKTLSNKAVVSEHEKNNAADKEDKKVGAKKNLGSWGGSGLKPFAVGVIVALLGSATFFAYQNFSSNQVRDFLYENLDGIVPTAQLDQILNLFLGETVVTEMRTKDDDSRRTDDVIGATDENSKKKDSVTGDSRDGKHDRKGDSLHQPSLKAVNEETLTQRAKDDEDLTKAKSPKSRYQKADITNKADNRIRHELDQADEALEKGKITEAIGLYDAIIGRYPNSPRAFFGKAGALNRLAEEKKSNAILEEAIAKFLDVLSLPDVPKSLAIKAAKAGAERQSFRGC